MPSRDAGRVKLARHLRRCHVPAEKLLWRELRGGELGFKFRRQHTIGPYIADFACCECKVVVELDGDSHTGTRPEAKDDEPTKFLEVAGWKVIRFWNSEVHDDVEAIVESTYLVCQGRSEAPPHPNPLPPQSRVERG